MIELIKKLVRETFLYNILIQHRQNKELVKWVKKGRSGPSPHLIKQSTIKEYSERFNIHTLIETGTFMGDMVFAMKDQFDLIKSIELSAYLFKRANKRFSKYSHIEFFQGDSASVLPMVLSSTSSQVLFWLDGHYSEGFTEKSDLHTPILNELESIFNHPIEDHVILIDDARCFTGQNDYPTLNELRECINKSRPNFNIEVKEDIIRIHKKNGINNDFKLS